MKSAKRFVQTILIASLFGCTSTPSPQHAAPELAQSDVNGSYGYMTRTGLVIHRNQDTQISYERYMGDACLKQLASINSLMRRISDSRCTATGLQTPQMRQICAQSEREYATRQRADQVCLAKRDAYAEQTLTLKAMRPGMTADFARLGQPIAQARFSAIEANAILPFNQIPSSQAARCYTLSDESGKTIPVRGAAYEDRYSFALPFVEEGGRLQETQQQIARLTQEIETLTQGMARQEQALLRNAAFEGGVCTRPAERSIPPRPDSMDRQELEYQINGGCTDLMMRRFSGNDVTNAFTRLSWDERIFQWRRWSDDPSTQHSCSKNLISQLDTSITEVGCSLFFKDQVLPACIQNMYQQCRAIAQSSCTRDISRWSSTVSRIRREPAQALETCQQTVSELRTNNERLPQLQEALIQARAAFHTAQARRIETERISLEQARCQ